MPILLDTLIYLRCFDGRLSSVAVALQLTMTVRVVAKVSLGRCYKECIGKYMFSTSSRLGQERAKVFSAFPKALRAFYEIYKLISGYGCRTHRRPLTLVFRYTGRFFLNHVFLEQAFDNLLEHGFKLASGAASGTNSTGELKPGMDSEENKWMHFNEYVFIR